jgi:alpha-L-fucosidase 2
MRLLADPLVESNFVTFSINYRLAPTNRWPACFEDVQTAIRWVKAHATEYKGDSKHIALIGYSAGGQLVCLAAVLPGNHTSVQAVVGCAAPTDMLADNRRRGALSKSCQDLLNRPPQIDAETEQWLSEISPINFIHSRSVLNGLTHFSLNGPTNFTRPGLPPFLLIHGTEDKSVPYDQSINFQAKLKENGVACDLVTVKGAGHRISDWPKFEPAYKEEMINWLSRVLGGVPTTQR